MPSPTESVKTAARESGFDRCGIAAAGPAPRAARLTEWLKRGYHATLRWMAREPERRTDPRQLLPGARTVICVALNYYHPAEHPTKPNAPKISRYAWGDDYHDIMVERLTNLVNRLRTILPDARFKTCCDTSAIMEKDWAQQAGIGWIAKSTNLTTRSHGSWLFLAEVITTAELDPDEPYTDYCGSCTRCLDACPTDAFPEPYVLDANKCISYLTIEHRGDFPSDIDPARFNGWIFGCDICQDVCPWNIKFARPTDAPRFAPRPDHLQIDPKTLAGESPEDFNTRFKSSPINRACQEGLRRNIVAAA